MVINCKPLYVIVTVNVYLMTFCISYLKLWMYIKYSVLVDGGVCNELLFNPEDLNPEENKGLGHPVTSGTWSCDQSGDPSSQ